MLKLSKHFIYNWKERVSAEVPDPKKINRIIKNSVRLLKGQPTVGQQDYMYTLTVYCHFGLNIGITVDHFTGTVVSVYSKANMPSYRTT